jgi:hypothetical protein
MTMKMLIVVWLIMAGVIGFPASAAAKGLDDLWDVLDQMSGPGPFNGISPISGKISCWEDGVKKVRTSMVNPDLSDPCLYFEFRRLHADPDGRFERVNATLATLGVTYHFAKVFEVGASGGLAVFSTKVGNTEYSVKNGIVSPRLVFKPLRAFVRRWRDNSRAGFLQMHLRPTIRFGEIDGADFGAPGANFSAGTEYLKGYSYVVIDVLEALRPQR